MDQNAVYLDGIDTREYGIKLLSAHDNPGIADTRDSSVTLPGMHGVLDFGAELESIPFNFYADIPAEDRMKMQAKIRELKGLLLDNGGRPKTMKLIFGYEPDKYYWVRYSGSMSVDRSKHVVGKLELPLICHEGFAHSVAKNDEVTWGSEEITFTAEYTLGHNGSGAKTFTAPGSTIVTLSGHNQRPVIHITGSGTNVTVGWAGKTFGLGSFANATWLIDLDEYVVLKNGLLNLDALSDDWLMMTLLKGDNLIEVNGSGLDLSFRVEFRDRYY